MIALNDRAEAGGTQWRCSLASSPPTSDQLEYLIPRLGSFINTRGNSIDAYVLFRADTGQIGWLVYEFARRNAIPPLIESIVVVSGTCYGFVDNPELRAFLATQGYEVNDQTTEVRWPAGRAVTLV